MTAPARERLVVDLRGLGPTLKAHANSRGLTVSEVARQALATFLASSGLAPETKPPGEANEQGKRNAKVTIRMRSQVATALAAASRASGVSQGLYIAALLASRPAPPVAIAAALGRSTDQLAVTLTDLNEVIRILARSNFSSGAAVDGWLKPLVVDLREHIEVAARLLGELRSPKSAARTSSRRGTGREGVSA